MAYLDRRDIGRVFRERLNVLSGRYEGNLAAFARAIGLDRSALSQFMTKDSTRLPRAETLCRIATMHGVTLDWLLGLTSTNAPSIELIPAGNVETNSDDGETQLSHWHREAAGYKIRYVPMRIPDLLRLDDAAQYEFRLARSQSDAKAKIAESRELLAYTRRPETDMEVCMPRQTLELLAAGGGVWHGLAKSVRLKQLEYMAALQRELYPTFRLFLYDGLSHFSSPFTLFGPIRAALYLGDCYLVTNSTDHVRELTKRFDNLIRHAEVGPDRSADFIDNLANRCDGVAGES